MLVQTPFKKNDVISIKLTSGEEIICRFQEETDSAFEIDKPMCIVPQQNGMGLAPFMMTTDKESFSLAKSAVVVAVATQENLAKSYLEQTSSIQLA